MLRTIAYRGPDHLEARAYKLSRNLHLTVGQVRLAIVDLSAAANQPFELESGHMLTFNGEFYNFNEVRQDLSADTRWRTHSDTEVALRLLARDGIAGLNRLDGMFAGVYLDAPAAKIHLFRDRFGKKPLYILPSADRLYFASEPKAILALLDRYPNLDQAALARYFMLGYIPDDRTAFQGMFQLPAGHHMSLSAAEPTASTAWYQADPNSQLGEDDLEPLFMKAVEKRMISDVPLGAFLSGGLDSSLVVAAMARLSDSKVNTFSVRFDGPQSFDESEYARLVARHCATQHEEISLDTDVLSELVPQVLDHFDEPFGDSSAVPSYLVSREARRHFTVALSGDGADEVFAGYRKYLGEYYIRKLGPYWLRRLFWSPAVQLLPHGRTSRILEAGRRVRRLLRGDAKRAASRHVRWLQMGGVDYDRLLQGPMATQRTTIEHELAARLPPSPTLNDLLMFDQQLVLTHDMFVKVDRMSMKASLEVRSPFVDHAIVELANRLPAERKLKGTQRKRVLVERLGHLVPHEILQRPKAGFEMPIGAWLRTSLKRYAEHVLFQSAETAPWVQLDQLRRIWDSHQNGGKDMTEPLWYHLVHAHWFQRYQSRQLHRCAEPVHG